MAVSLPESSGSGEFVPVRVWSCSQHDSPQDHYCDCEYCNVGTLCEECDSASWVDKVDENGEVVMRELSLLEATFRNTMKGKPLFAAPLLMRHMLADINMDWSEDEAMPKLGGAE